MTDTRCLISLSSDLLVCSHSMKSIGGSSTKDPGSVTENDRKA